MRRLRTTLLAALATTLLLPGSAFASVQQASVTDPEDQTDPGLDIASATARHDTTSGTTFTVVLRGAPSTAAGGSLLVSVGVYDGNECTGRVQAAASVQPGSAAAGTIDDRGTFAEVPVTRTASGTTITLTTPGVRPGGAEVDCAFLRTYDVRTADRPVYDSVPRFALQTDTPAPPPPPPPPPPSEPTPTPEPAPVPAAPEGTPGFSLPKSKPGRTVLHGLCGPSVCRLDPATRKRTRVLKGTSKAPYTAVSTSLSGGVVAYARQGKVLRAGRDGRGRTDYGPGSAPAVRADGRVVAFARTIQKQSPPFCTPDLSGGPLTCTFTTPIVPTPTIFTRNAGAQDAVQRGSAIGSFAWSRELLVRTTTESGSKPSFVCATTANSACATPVAQETGRALSSQQASPDGRLLVAVAEAKGARNADDPKRRGTITLYDPRTGAKVRDLTTGTADAHPAFSPDGKQVAFDRGGNLYALRTTGGKPKLLTRGMVLSGASWSQPR